MKKSSIRLFAVIPLLVLLSACANKLGAGKFVDQPGATANDYPITEFNYDIDELVTELPGTTWSGSDVYIGECMSSDIDFTIIDYTESINMIRAEVTSDSCKFIEGRFLGKIHPYGMVAVASFKKDRQIFLQFNLKNDAAAVKIKVVDADNPADVKDTADVVFFKKNDDKGSAKKKSGKSSKFSKLSKKTADR